jgi:hypothetical protein
MPIRAWLYKLRERDLGAGVGLAAVVLVAFLPALSPRSVLFERDISVWWHPQVECFVRAIAEGTWPVWNPYFSFGLPLWEDPAVQIAYPPTWLNLVLMPTTYYKLFALGHSWLGAQGLYTFLRAMGIGRGAAFLGGAVWCCCGPFASAVSLFHHYASSSWMGWVLYGVVRLTDSPGAGNALRLGAMAGMLALAGSADVVVMTALLATGLLVARSAVLRSGRVWRSLALSVVFAAATAAVQWLPTSAYVLSTGSRTSFTPDQNMYWSLHPAALIDLVVPRLVADLSLIPSLRARLFEAREPFLPSQFLGVPAAGLVLLALFGRRDRIIGVSAVLFILLLLLALGRHTPVLPWVLHVPVVAVLRFPVKALFAGALVWAILAGFGLDLWLRQWGGTERRAAGRAAALMALLATASCVVAYAFASGRLDSWLARPAAEGGAAPAPFRLGVAAAGAIVTTLLVLWRRSRDDHRRWSAAAMAAVAIMDLCAAAHQNHLYGPKALIDSPPAVLDHIERPIEHRRVQFSPFTVPEMVDGFAAKAGWDVHWVWMRGALETLAPPSGARWRLAGAFDGDFTGLTPAPLPLMADVLRSAGDRAIGTRLLELGAVEYFVSLMSIDRPGLERTATIPSAYGLPIQLYKVGSHLPRAYVVGGARIVPPGADPLRTLLDPSFDPRVEVVLAAGEARRSPSSFQGSARIVRRTFRSVVIDVETSDAGHLVLVETMVPGWRARVDGAPSPMVRANGTFRAVEIPAGAHRVEMDYLPPAVFWGCLVTASAWFAAAAWAVASRMRSPSPGEEPAAASV